MFPFDGLVTLENNSLITDFIVRFVRQGGWCCIHCCNSQYRYQGNKVQSVNIQFVEGKKTNTASQPSSVGLSVKVSNEDILGD